jgi:hypothetical protein
MNEGAGGSPGALPDVDWAEVRLAYELSADTVASIEKRFGLTRYQLSRRRRAEGWTTRPPVARPLVLPRRKPIGSEVLALRLNRLLVTGIAMLDKRVSEEGMTEGNARTLTELCRAEEIRMRSTRTKTGKPREKKNHDAGYDFRDDPVWLDAEINRRLDRLHGQGAAAGDPGAADAGAEAGVSGALAGTVGAA